RSQVFEPLPHTHERNGQAELVRDRDCDAALRRAVQLRQSDAGYVDRLAEQACLLEAVLTRGRVDDEQRLVRATLDPAGDHAADLGELLHQIRLRVQTARGVDDHDVTATRDR